MNQNKQEKNPNSNLDNSPSFRSPEGNFRSLLLLPCADKERASLGVRWEAPATTQGRPGEFMMGSRKKKKVEIVPRCPELAGKAGKGSPDAAPLRGRVRKRSRQQVESPLRFAGRAWGSLPQPRGLIRRIWSSLMLLQERAPEAGAAPLSPEPAN